MERMPGQPDMRGCQSVRRFMRCFRTALEQFRCQSGAGVAEAGMAESAYFLHPLPCEAAHRAALHDIIPHATEVQAILPRKGDIRAVTGSPRGLERTEQQVCALMMHDNPACVGGSHNVSTRKGRRGCRHRHANS
ncbi:hypothetical protein AA0312_0686 [Acetobacter tropicalis NRIC 0312]|uniref:Uncharacterized protein n=1 Tax=Acetobacter tropicalis TaxID=104102 RepID=A0A511FPJ5_9PROT|nr:hypothetical protein ATR1_070c0051 [Acetobacter tropicalis]GBR67970.1 hypothetical protein AA0312_0686 [Acetobacter tropicalis NRIC 0312]GEL50829.1 hypothetical protein ATR01nite_19040 [Acetobacter tropicalis]